MNDISPNRLLEALRWRYATKKFDPTRRIELSTWAALEEALILTPSSYGLQPWVFHVVTNQQIKDRLVPHTWNQRQVADCSHLVVFAIQKSMTPEYVEGYVNEVATSRGIDPNTLEGFRKMMVRDIVEGPRGAQSEEWAKLQAYIALGNFMTSCALLNIDTCPMEGFQAAGYDSELGLEPLGQTTAVVCPAGYRAHDDKYAALPKVRFSRSRMIQHHD